MIPKRTIGKTGISVFPLGLGCMRFPIIDGDSANIDEVKTKEMVAEFLDKGGQYFDTAYVYHSQKSEVMLGKILNDLGRRNEAIIATKLPLRPGMGLQQYDETLNESLRRLQTDYIDFYLLHGIRAKTLDDHAQVLDWLAAKVKEGKVRFPSHSFHDDAQAYRRVVDAFPWAMSQVQMNILDVNNQATLEGLKYAADKGIGIVIMEPLRGGSLASAPPANVQAVYDSVPIQRSPVEWAFRFLLDMPEVDVILSGMSNMEQLQDNIRIFTEAGVGNLSDGERQMLEKARCAYESRVLVPCTGCRYCMPCPQGVEIPRIFDGANRNHMFGELTNYSRRYTDLVSAQKAFDQCVRCNACQEACPQHILVPDELEKIHKVLT